MLPLFWWSISQAKGESQQGQARGEERQSPASAMALPWAPWHGLDQCTVDGCEMLRNPNHQLIGGFSCYLQGFNMFQHVSNFWVVQDFAGPSTVRGIHTEDQAQFFGIRKHAVNEK